MNDKVQDQASNSRYLFFRHSRPWKEKMDGVLQMVVVPGEVSSQRP